MGDSDALIRLDAATVLLQWATGGLLFLWVTSRRRLLGIGYGWLLRTVYVVIAVGAVAAGQLTEPVPVRDARRGPGGGRRPRSPWPCRSSGARRVCRASGPCKERRAARVAAMLGTEGSVGGSTTDADAPAAASPLAIARGSSRPSST